MLLAKETETKDLMQAFSLLFFGGGVASFVGLFD